MSAVAMNLGYPNFNQVQGLDPKRILLPNEAQGLQNEKTMKTTGIALIVIGALGILLAAAAIVAGALGMSLGLLPAGALLGIGIGLAVASITSLAIGILLMRRPYWQDQNYMDRQTELALKMPYQEIVDTYGWERILEQHLISRDTFKNKFLESVKGKKYLQILQDHGAIIREHNFIDWSEFADILKANAKIMSARVYKSYYGDQPLEDGVIAANDPWFKKMILDGIEKLPYHQIMSDFPLEHSKGTFTDANIKEILEKQYANSTFHAFFIAQGKQKMWSIIDNGILPAEYFTKKAISEKAGRGPIASIEHVLKTYGSEIFTKKVLSIEDCKGGLLGEIQELSFSQIISTYKWEILHIKMLEPSDLNPFAVKECEGLGSFAELLKTFTEKVFAEGVLSDRDQVVKVIIKKMCKEMEFCTMIDTYSGILAKYNLLPQIKEIPILLDAKLASETKMTRLFAEADQLYRNKQSAADAKRDAALSQPLNNWNNSKRQLNQFQASHEAAIDRIRNQITNENTEHFFNNTRNLQDKTGAAAAIELIRHETRRASLDSAMAQEEEHHRSFLLALQSLCNEYERQYTQVKAEQDQIHASTMEAALTQHQQTQNAARVQCQQEKAVINEKFKAIDFDSDGS